MSAEPEVIEGEATELVPMDRQTPSTLFGTDDPAAIIQQAADKATHLKRIITEQGLATQIGPGKPHVQLEGWTTLGSMVGVFAIADGEPRELLNDDGELIGFEARAVARTLDGREVGAATARCTRRERNWKSKDENQLLSMAQTRACSKALRLPLSFIMTLAGYSVTPREEIDTGEPSGAASQEGRSHRTPPASEGSTSGGPVTTVMGKDGGAGSPEPDSGEENAGTSSPESHDHVYVRGTCKACGEAKP